MHQSGNTLRLLHREPIIMTEFTGRLANAPVVYVLAQIRFTAVLQMIEYIPAIQEALRGSYPRYEQQQLATLDINADDGSARPSISNRWIFNDKSEEFGFIIDQSSIVFHTSSYVDFPDFQQRLLAGVKVVQELVNIPLIERVGLRYIDLIMPVDGEHVDQYVEPSFRGFSLAGVGLEDESAQQIVGGKTGMGQLVVRFSTGKHAMPLPPDLMALGLQTKRRPNPTIVSTIMDTDHYAQRSIDFSLVELTELLNALQEPIGNVFKSAITEHAVERWRQEYEQ
jgi:uncharacterized protein (TIGR04255 family)